MINNLIALFGVLVCVAGATLIFAVNGSIGIPVAAVGVVVIAFGLFAGRSQTGTPTAR